MSVPESRPVAVVVADSAGSGRDRGRFSGTTGRQSRPALAVLSARTAEPSPIERYPSRRERAALGDGDFKPTPPVLAAERLVAAGYHDLGERHEHLRRAHRDLQQLQDAMVACGSILERTRAWRQLDQVQTRELIAELDRAARRETLRLCAVTAPARTPVRQLLHSRTICARRLVEERGGDLTIQSLARDSQVRIGARLTTSMRIIDGQHVVLGPLAPDRPSGAYIRSPRIASALRHVFDLLWEESMPVLPSGPPGRLTEAQWRVLRLLALGLDDTALARVTGTTVKTVRTHVAAILTALDAPTRFAAGAEAIARGWLS